MLKGPLLALGFSGIWGCLLTMKWDDSRCSLPAPHDESFEEGVQRRKGTSGDNFATAGKRITTTVLILGFTSAQPKLYESSGGEKNG